MNYTYVIARDRRPSFVVSTVFRWGFFTRLQTSCHESNLATVPSLTTVAIRLVRMATGALRRQVQPEHMTSALQSSLASIDSAVMRVRNGEPQVFALIVERFQQPLRAWLAARCPPELDANEIAQAVMVAAYTRLDDYQIGSDMAAWMWAIARHQLRGEITRLTRQRDVRARHWPVIAYEELLRRCDKDDASESRLSALSECLKQLSAAARTVLDLRYTRELDSDAIAEQTGRTSAAIRKQLTMVRRSLHDCITRQDKEVVS